MNRINREWLIHLLIKVVKVTSNPVNAKWVYIFQGTDGHQAGLKLKTKANLQLCNLICQNSSHSRKDSSSCLKLGIDIAFCIYNLEPLILSLKFVSAIGINRNRMSYMYMGKLNCISNVKISSPSTKQSKVLYQRRSECLANIKNHILIALSNNRYIELLYCRSSGYRCFHINGYQHESELE